jgi:uncharacterized protein (DUF58 family)
MSFTSSALSIRIAHWISGRDGVEHGDVLLDRRRVYILPTRAGTAFGLSLFVMLLGSINYQLQLGFMLTFFVASVALVGMYHTHRNLARVVLRAQRAHNVFAGDLATFEIAVHNPTPEARYALEFEPLEDMSRLQRAVVGDRPVQPITNADIPAAGDRNVSVALAARRRGRLPCPRLRIETRYPLGLWQAWAYYTPPLMAIIYPTPEQDAPSLPAATAGDSADEHLAGLAASGDDFAGVRPYRAGDPLKTVAWKLAARSDELSVKLFEAHARGELMLDSAQLPPSLSAEQRIARLTRWVLMAEAAQLRYGLALPGRRIAPGLGTEQRERCLVALALLEV